MKVIQNLKVVWFCWGLMFCLVLVLPTPNLFFHAGDEGQGFVLIMHFVPEPKTLSYPIRDLTVSLMLTAVIVCLNRNCL